MNVDKTVIYCRYRGVNVPGTECTQAAVCHVALVRAGFLRPGGRLGCLLDRVTAKAMMKGKVISCYGAAAHTSAP